jgi:TonB family protein
MMERNSDTEMGSPLAHAASEQQQRRRMLVALGVLLLALISVLIKDRQFWFPPSPSAESEAPEQIVPQGKPLSSSPKTVAPVVPLKPATPAAQARPKSKRLTTTASSSRNHDTMSPAIVATNRAVLPPLEVEVVAGNQHRAVSPGDSSVKLDMQSSAPDSSDQTEAPDQNQASVPADSHAAAHVQLSRANTQLVSRVDPSYPLLAKQMKVQGAVILEALISRTGSIQDIQVLSGPAILSEAAREAVKQWHFKPYYQGGRAVETAARITVNFTISTY